MITSDTKQKIDELVECSNIARCINLPETRMAILALIGSLTAGDEFDSDVVEMIASNIEPSDENLPLHAALWGIIS